MVIFYNFPGIYRIFFCYHVLNIDYLPIKYVVKSRNNILQTPKINKKWNKVFKV